MLDWVKSIWEWSVSNLATLKDFLWIIFTFVATLVAILTYRRARFTLLQPLRTEVIKKQTDLLIDLLDFFDSSVLFSLKLDYMNIVSLNVFKQIQEHNFNLNEATQDTEIDSKLAGAIFSKDTVLPPHAQKTDVFEKTDVSKLSATYEQENKKQRYINAKNGTAKIDGVYFTKQYFLCNEQLNKFANNPFLPIKIKKELDELIKDINYNLDVSLRDLLKEFVLELCSSEYQPEHEIPVKIQPEALYNKFVSKSKEHNSKISNIKELVRDYLMIDKQWN